MDVIWDNEPTTCPPIILNGNSDTPIVEVPSCSVRSSPGRGTPSPGGLSDVMDESESPNSFNTGKKVQSQRTNKLDEVFLAMTKNLEIQCKVPEVQTMIQGVVEESSCAWSH
jgi:hypothetical protein